MLGFSPLNSWFQTLLRYYLKLTNVTIGRNPPLEAVNTPLEALDTFVVKDQYSHLVYPNICITKQNCENLGSIGHQSLKSNNERKNTLVALSDA